MSGKGDHPTRSLDIAKLIASHKGKWITLSHDNTRVVGVGTTVEIALRETREKGEQHPLLVKSPDQYTPSLLWLTSRFLT